MGVLFDMASPIMWLDINKKATKAGILRPGSSRNSFQKRFAQASELCVVEIIYPDSGRGSHFQYPDLFLSHAM
jgi:hypothetical protein